VSQAGGPLGHVCERLDQFLVFEGLQEIDLVLNTVASLVFVIDESQEPIYPERFNFTNTVWYS